MADAVPDVLHGQCAMSSNIQTQAVWVWMSLVVLTAGSYFFGSLGGGSGGGHILLLLVLAIALGKVWLVGRYFMELKHAPPPLRRVADIWLVITGCIILGLFITSWEGTLSG